MDADRLERSAQFLHSTTLSVGSIVIGAVGLDKVRTTIDVAWDRPDAAVIAGRPRRWASPR